MTHRQYAPHPLRNGSTNQANRKRRNSDDLPLGIGDYVPTLQPSLNSNHHSSSRLRDPPVWAEAAHRSVMHVIGLLRTWRPRDLLWMPLGLIIIWMVALWYGEEAVFTNSVEACAWGQWEGWPATATPHHVVLVADPQLVDPHTYPGRPWPLSSLTMSYTDLYMRKSFQRITQTLSPDSVFFLGDLFDGGREWTTGSGFSDERVSPDKRWRKYATKYWVSEYGRFSRIFFDTWLRGTSKSWHGQRKLVAGLPGNHDLGLGNGVRLPVRRRFQTYFGNGNRVDIVGNHTFVSIDTVSLSAKGQPKEESPTRMRVNGENVTMDHNKDVWDPVDQFLHNVQAEKSRSIERELRVRAGLSENEVLDSTAVELKDARAHRVTVQTKGKTEIPSVVLTHVPFWRDPGTPCGPLRERFPPSKPVDVGGEPLQSDDANAIHIQAGVQYQNVLTEEVSSEIVDLVGNVTHVFSGDDHDYCDVTHHGYTSLAGGIREITVKSISWAMGVRKPGFLLVSLWNPITADGMSLSNEKSTVQTELCLLPDQLSIFIRYGWLLCFTSIVLLVRAVRISYSARPRSTSISTKSHILPLRNSGPSFPVRQETTSAATHSSSAPNSVSARLNATKPRTDSPSAGYSYRPPIARLPSPPYSADLLGKSTNGAIGGQKWNEIALNDPSRRRRRRGLLAVYDEFRSSVLQVAFIVLVWYFWLLWNS